MVRHVVRLLPGLPASLVLTASLASAQTPAPPPDVEQRIKALDAKVRELQGQLAAARAAAAAAPVATTARVTPPPTSADRTGAVSDGSALSLEALEERLDELDQQVRVVARQAEIDREAAVEKSKTTPVVTAGREGFVLKSADSNFQLRIRGYAQSDARYFASGGGPLAPDTFVLRRVRPVFEGTLFKNFDFKVMPDFGGGTTVLQDAYLDLRFTPALKVRAGKFKGPIGLERLISATDMPFVERAFPTALAPNRDVGVVVFGDVLKNTLNYTVGLQNGVVDGGSADVDDRDGKDAVARVFALPFRNGAHDRLRQLGLGIAGTFGSQRGSLLSPNLPVYRTSGQAVFARYRLDTALGGTTIANGSHWRVSPQGYYYTGPFGLLGEYILSSQEVRRGDTATDLASRAWQLAGSWVVTGEDSSYRGVAPRAIFDPSKGTWGALELTTRYNALALDRDAFPVFANPTAAARTARAWAVGTNWYLNRAVKVTVDFEETLFEGGAASGDRPTERNVLTRFQFGY